MRGVRQGNQKATREMKGRHHGPGQQAGGFPGAVPQGGQVILTESQKEQLEFRNINGAAFTLLCELVNRDGINWRVGWDNDPFEDYEQIFMDCWKLAEMWNAFARKKWETRGSTPEQSSE